MKPAIGLLLLCAVFISAAPVFGQPTVRAEDVVETSYTTSNQDSASVLLVNFKSYKSASKEITITWTTGKEVNNDFFTLEHSINGVDFSTIALLRGKNRSYTYTVTDGAPLSSFSYTNYVYYRLSQTGMDGKLRYFDVLKVLLRGVPGVLVISPNPVKDQLQIQLRTEEKGPVEISIITHNGMLVKQWVLQKKDEMFQETLSVSDLAEGNYILQAKMWLMVETQYFVKH
ncbi:MAG: T9SS type A sorting domain-containing protein [Chitinophagaceae bacterium]